MDRHTRELVDRYVAGELDDAQCVFVEQLAVGDREVAEALSSGLLPVERAFRRAFPYLPKREREFDYAAPEAQERRWPWTALAAAAAVVALAVLLWPREESLRLESASGAVIVGDRSLAPGDPVPVGESVVALGQAVLTFGDVRMTTDPVAGCFRIERGPAGLRIVSEVGDLAFRDGERAAQYDVSFAGLTARPLGTRFSVSAPSESWSAINVFEDRVEVSDNGKRQVVGEGRGLLRGQPGTVQDDLAAIPVGGAMMVPTPGGLVERKRLEPSQPPEELQSRLRSAFEAPIAEGFWRASIAMAEFEESVSSAHFAAAALDAGFQLGSARDEDVWALLRFHSRKAGDGRMALVLAGEVERRGGDARRYRDLVAAWSQDGQEGGMARISAAEGFGDPADPQDALLVAEALVFGYQEFQQEKRHLARAIGLLERVAEDGSLGLRTRAVAYQRIGEAVYFRGPKRESIAWTKRAVELWPRPRWKVHVGTRMTECDAAPLEEALVWIGEGLVEEPSYYAYERACVALYAGATRNEEFEQLRQLCLFVARTYKSVPDAQAHMAQWLALIWKDLAVAEPFVDRAVEIWGDNLPDGYRNDWGAVLVRSGRKQEGWDFATSGKQESDRSLIGFYDKVGDWDRALACLEAIPIEERDAHFPMARGTFLLKLGRKREGLADLRAYIALERRHFAEHGRWSERGALADALVTVAEATGDRRLASEALAALSEQDDTSAGGKRGRSLTQARAQLVLGEPGRAADTVRRFLAGPHLPEQREQAVAILARAAPD
jgi:hypothetical protein